MRFHCLFEQSGTFKNVFKSYGHEAYDYDILDEYGQTDFKMDLFEQIEIAYERTIGNYDYKLNRVYDTIFDKMKPDNDFILAFFPCTFFTDLNEMLFKGFRNTSKSNIKGNKLTGSQFDEVLKRNKERNKHFEIWLKFCYVADVLGLRTIIENPVGMLRRNYLTLYSPYRPTFEDKDRSNYGDLYVKPTQYFSINFDMKEEFIMCDKQYNTKNPTCQASGKVRSEITSRYAENFYKRFIEKQIKKEKQK